MLKTFILLATVWNPDAAQFDRYVLDHDLSGPDCIEILIQTYESPTVQLTPVVTLLDSTAAELACIVDEIPQHR